MRSHFGIIITDFASYTTIFIKWTITLEFGIGIVTNT